VARKAANFLHNSLIINDSADFEPVDVLFQQWRETTGTIGKTLFYQSHSNILIRIKLTGH